MLSPEAIEALNSVDFGALTADDVAKIENPAMRNLLEYVLEKRGEAEGAGHAQSSHSLTW